MKRFLFIAACAGGLLSGTAQWAAAQQMPSSEEAASTASVQDTKLERKIDYRLQHDQKLKARNVDASVSAGVVTLTGMVRTSAEKSRAEKLARTKGVSDVDNQIEIEGQASTSAPQGAAQPSGEEPQAQPPSEGTVRERTTKVEERTETRTERVPQPSNEQQPSSAPSDEAVPQPAPPARPAPPSAPVPSPRSNMPQQ